MANHNTGCPLSPVEKRLDDAHQLWHQADQSYFEPDQFRLAAQSTIQALRSVTFLLQKHKSIIPAFDAWYGTHDKRGRWQERLASIPLMRWLVEARNQIEKEGDLATQSFVRAEIIASHLDEGPRSEVPAHLFEGPKKLLAGLPKDLLQHIRDNGVLRIERRWVADDLPDFELLEALAAAFGTLAELVHDAHLQMGLPTPATIDTETGEAYDAASLGWRLPCMIRHGEPRATHISLSDGAPIKFETMRRPLAPDAGKVLTERYGVDPRAFFAVRPDSLEAHAQRLFELARMMFLRDGYHVPVVFLFRGTDQLRVTQMNVEQRKEKYLRSRFIADEVARLGADGVVMIGEAWLARQSVLKRYQAPAEAQDREEAVSLHMAVKSGATMSLMAKIHRDGDVVSLGDTETTRGGVYYDFGPTFAVWGIPIDQSRGAK
jgi:hypothetical protein